MDSNSQLVDSIRTHTFEFQLVLLNFQLVLLSFQLVTRVLPYHHKFVLNLLQRLDLKNFENRTALQNLSIYYTWKYVRQRYKNNKLKITAPTWNNEFELSDGSYSVNI